MKSSVGSEKTEKTEKSYPLESGSCTSVSHTNQPNASQESSLNDLHSKPSSINSNIESNSAIKPNNGCGNDATNQKRSDGPTSQTLSTDSTSLSALSPKSLSEKQPKVSPDCVASDSVNQSKVDNLPLQSQEINSVTKPPDGALNGSKGKTSELKNQKKKKTLRKGKWTPEEEEYTEKVIEHFSSGVLALPEGMTLRSYLAEKLYCDPMRITKKFAGSSCLGKRLSRPAGTKPNTSINDAELAFKELSYYEARFRIRVETGFPGLLIDPPNAPVQDNNAILKTHLQANLLNNTNNMPPSTIPIGNPSWFPTGISSFPMMNQMSLFMPTVDHQANLNPGIHMPIQNQFSLPWVGANMSAVGGDPMSNFLKMMQGKNDTNTSTQGTINQMKQNVQPFDWNQSNISPLLFQESLKQMTLANLNSQMIIPQSQGFPSLTPNVPSSSVNSTANHIVHQEPKVGIELQNVNASQQKNRENAESNNESSKSKAQQSALTHDASRKNGSLLNLNRGSRTKEENDSAKVLLGFVNSLRQSHQATLAEVKEKEEQNTEKISRSTQLNIVTSRKENIKSLDTNSSHDRDHRSSRQEGVTSLCATASNPSDISSNSSKDSLNEADCQRESKSGFDLSKQQYTATGNLCTKRLSPSIVSTSTSSNPSDFSSTSSKASSNGDYCNKQSKPYPDSSRTQTITASSLNEKNLASSRTITLKKRHLLHHLNRESKVTNGEHIQNSNFSSMNGSSTSDCSGGYDDETDRPSTLTSSEGTKTDNSSASTSSEDDSDKDSSERKKEMRSLKRRKTTTFSSSPWELYRN